MKKFIVLFSVLLCSTTTLFAETFFEPQWNEFCPKQYINLDESKDYIKPEKSYWANRKREFNQRLQICRNSYDKDAC